jgi:hypothetical protein
LLLTKYLSRLRALPEPTVRLPAICRYWIITDAI